MNKPGTLGLFLGYLWSSPLTLIGVLLMLIYIPTSVRWKDGRLEVVTLWILGNPGAQTHGIIIFFCHKNAREDKGLVVHECVHIVQGMNGGVLYGFAYVFEFLGIFLLNCPDDPAGTPRWFRAYWHIGFEEKARRYQESFMRGERQHAWGSS